MAQTRKERGSAFFKQGRYEEALECYLEARQHGDEADSRGVPAQIALYCNESFACLKLQRHGQACRAALNACDLDVTRAKSLFRLASALLESGLARAASEVASVGIALSRYASVHVRCIDMCMSYAFKVRFGLELYL
jgi:tetratricopeptide (TPR) repeat protein